MYYIMDAETDRILETWTACSVQDLQKLADFLNAPVYAIDGQHTGLSAEPTKTDVAVQLSLSGAIEEENDESGN